MTRNEYKVVLLAKGFMFEKTQKGYPSRGDEDVYAHAGYQYKFYVTRVRKDNQSLYGFYTGKKNGEHLDALVPRNASDDFRNDKALNMWTNNAFAELMERFGS